MHNIEDRAITWADEMSVQRCKGEIQNTARGTCIAVNIVTRTDTPLRQTTPSGIVNGNIGTGTTVLL